MGDHSQEKYFNRELSWLQFNARVLAEAMDSTNPVLERLKFIGIVGSNFDEFFMVRVPSLSESDSLVRRIYEEAFSLLDKQNLYFTEELVPKLQEAGIVRLAPQALDEKQQSYIKNLFVKELLPLLTPIAIREEYPAPALSSLSLYLVAEVMMSDQPSTRHYALIEIPKNYPRMISLPSDKGSAFILIEDVISFFAQELFRGFEVGKHGLIRLTRAAEFTVDEENDEDFAKVMSEALRSRRENAIVRLEVAASDEMCDFLKGMLGVEGFRIYKNKSWFDLKTIAQIAFQPAFEDFKRPAWRPCAVSEIENGKDFWGLLKQKDVLVHYPYESFGAFAKFIWTAAEDPDVLAIKQTLYRTGLYSSVISALEKAAEKGKQVTVLVELKARFDEEQNIGDARRLEKAGATVLYGVAGFKTHAKACLVVRREIDGIQRYLHLGTGNYNEKTAKSYSDIGLFTSQEEITRDVASFFNVITGFSHPSGFSKIEMAPYGLRRRLLRLILREGVQSTEEHPGLIIAKMNSLVDPEIIEALYRASQKGVKIKLNVRGICCLRPGIKGLSENIEVISVVDMFLEHSRIYYFNNGGEEEVYLSSADWMPRNLDRRIELMFPVEDKKNKKELIRLLSLYFKDNVKAWFLLPDGEYKKKEPGSEKRFRVQEFLCQQALQLETALEKAAPLELKPQKPKKET